jgi:penicillin-binding protein 1A
MRWLVRFVGFLFTVGTVVFLVGVAAVAGLIWHYSRDLPEYSQLQDYEPPVMTRVHAADGALLGEYSKERRLYLPIQAVPKLVINAFLAAEDKNFYEHGGIDFTGMGRARQFCLRRISAPTGARRARPQSPSRSRRTSF